MEFKDRIVKERKFTATEDVNYSTHSSRSSFRSESLTSRADGRNRSTSSEIVANGSGVSRFEVGCIFEVAASQPQRVKTFSGSDTRSYPVYIAIQDYVPDKEDVEGIPLEQGQIVEARPPKSGWVPGSYFETPTEYYKQRRRTREIDAGNLTEEQAAVVKRDQVYHELLRSEEEFVSSLRSCVDDYIKVMDDPGVPETVKQHKEDLAINIPELYNFHAKFVVFIGFIHNPNCSMCLSQDRDALSYSKCDQKASNLRGNDLKAWCVMLKGLNYYSDDPGKVGQTFVRLEHDFEAHVEFYKHLNTTLELLEKPDIKQFFQTREAVASRVVEILRNSRVVPIGFWRKNNLYREQKSANFNESRYGSIP
ncbi:unnamed protein product [Caenorhabditis auriculariae]|uniref:DH domain-containing protein n=1 Tax=Caenorhabditis auriculariae TaxID=2777116 RepID=A0A8S1H3Q3_9PELO|nr:unnamed protein product [Caenorhabditis auriculariae]